MQTLLKNALNIAQKENSPFYLYDKTVVERQIKALKNHMPEFDFLYSVKTNPFKPLVKAIVGSGLGADSASLEEVFKAEEAGVKAADIYYSAPGKTVEDLKKAFGRCIIIADSLTELEAINSIAQAAGKTEKVGLRINPNTTMFGGKGTPSKFGVDEEILSEKNVWIKALANIKVVGIHVHLRSQVLSEEVLYTYYQTIFELADSCAANLETTMEFINFGGGLGIPYSSATEKPLNMSALGERCSALIKNYKNQNNVRLIIESGRYIVGECGYYVTPVVDVKTSRGKKYAIVRNGLNGFMRPSVAALLNAATKGNLAGFTTEPLFTSKDAFDVLLLKNPANGPAGASETVDVVGNLCTAADIIAENIVLPQVEKDDYIVVTKAGSYSYSLSPLMFSSHPLPGQFLIEENGEVIL